MWIYACCWIASNRCWGASSWPFGPGKAFNILVCNQQSWPFSEFLHPFVWTNSANTQNAGWAEDWKLALHTRWLRPAFTAPITCWRYSTKVWIRTAFQRRICLPHHPTGISQFKGTKPKDWSKDWERSHYMGGLHFCFCVLWLEFTVYLTGFVCWSSLWTQIPHRLDAILTIQY